MLLGPAARRCKLRSMCELNDVGVIGKVFRQLVMNGGKIASFGSIDDIVHGREQVLQRFRRFDELYVCFAACLRTIGCSSRGNVKGVLSTRT